MFLVISLRHTSCLSESCRDSLLRSQGPQICPPHAKKGRGFNSFSLQKPRGHSWKEPRIVSLPEELIALHLKSIRKWNTKNTAVGHLLNKLLVSSFFHKHVIPEVLHIKSEAVGLTWQSQETSKANVPLLSPPSPTLPETREAPTAWWGEVAARMMLLTDLGFAKSQQFCSDLWRTLQRHFVPVCKANGEYWWEARFLSFNSCWNYYIYHYTKTQWKVYLFYLYMCQGEHELQH